MLRLFLLRFVLPLVAFLVIRYVVKMVWGSPGGPPAARRDPPGGELVQDPVCGTYVAANTSVTRTVSGKTLHFCSPACRDKYRPA